MENFVFRAIPFWWLFSTNAGIHQFHHHEREICLFGGEIHTQELHYIRVANSVNRMHSFIKPSLIAFFSRGETPSRRREWISLAAQTNPRCFTVNMHFAIGASSQILSSWFNSFKSKLSQLLVQISGSHFRQKGGWAGYSIFKRVLACQHARTYLRLLDLHACSNRTFFLINLWKSTGYRTCIKVYSIYTYFIHHCLASQGNLVNIKFQK